MARWNSKSWSVIVLPVGGTFSPLRERLGFHARQMTPKVIRKVAILAAETRSYKRGVIALAEAEVPVSAKTVERIVHEIGGELAARRDADDRRHSRPRAYQRWPTRTEIRPCLAAGECARGC